MSAEVHQFPKAASLVERDRRGAGASPDLTPAASKPGRADLSPAQKVRVAYRFTWRGASRCAAGTDLGAGYRMMTRACMSGLIQAMGAVRAADYLMTLAMEAAIHVDTSNDDGPKAA